MGIEREFGSRGAGSGDRAMYGAWRYKLHADRQIHKFLCCCSEWSEQLIHGSWGIIENRMAEGALSMRKGMQDLRRTMLFPKPLIDLDLFWLHVLRKMRR